jgi:hypothetical protein
MFKKILLISIICASFAIIPFADAQLSFGKSAYQELVQLTLDKTDIVQAKHVIGSSNNPVSVYLFEGVIVESISVTNNDGEELQFGILGMGNNEASVSILEPIKENAIVKYNLKNIFWKSDTLSKLDIGYPQTFSIIFAKEVEFVFLNNNLIQLGNQKGINIIDGGYVIVEYFNEIPKLIENIQWEEEKFNVEILSDSIIDEFNFEQTSKSINFQINEKNKIFTIILPKELLGGPYVVLLDNEKIGFWYQEKDENNVMLSIKPELTGKITIIGTTVIPEFSMFIPLIMGFVIVLTIPFMKKFSLH